MKQEPAYEKEGPDPNKLRSNQQQVKILLNKRSKADFTVAPCLPRGGGEYLG